MLCAIQWLKFSLSAMAAAAVAFCSTVRGLGAVAVFLLSVGSFHASGLLYYSFLLSARFHCDCSECAIYKIRVFSWFMSATNRFAKIS